jgi:hypothetical protein
MGGCISNRVKLAVYHRCRERLFSPELSSAAPNSCPASQVARRGLCGFGRVRCAAIKSTGEEHVGRNLHDAWSKRLERASAHALHGVI